MDILTKILMVAMLAVGSIIGFFGGQYRGGVKGHNNCVAEVRQAVESDRRKRILKYEREIRKIEDKYKN